MAAQAGVDLLPHVAAVTPAAPVALHPIRCPDTLNETHLPAARPAAGGDEDRGRHGLHATAAVLTCCQ